MKQTKPDQNSRIDKTETTVNFDHNDAVPICLVQDVCQCRPEFECTICRSNGDGGDKETDASGFIPLMKQAQTLVL